jgi:TetR/AcrR family transcriptional regulator, transcriptional repressor for nem operon
MTTTSTRPRLTAKGERVRTRIVEVAAALIHERGVAATTLDDVKAAAGVSGSQLYHYFPDKSDLVHAVIGYQTDAIVNAQRQVLLSGRDGLDAWRSLLVSGVGHAPEGGCPIGSLGGQLAETDPDARALVATAFEQWSTALGEGLRMLHAEGKLPASIDPDDLATTLLATVQGGLLLAQVQRSPRPFETAIDTLFALAGVARPTDNEEAVHTQPDTH